MHSRKSVLQAAFLFFPSFFLLSTISGFSCLFSSASLLKTIVFILGGVPIHDCLVGNSKEVSQIELPIYVKDVMRGSPFKQGMNVLSTTISMLQSAQAGRGEHRCREGVSACPTEGLLTEYIQAGTLVQTRRGAAA